MGSRFSEVMNGWDQGGVGAGMGGVGGLDSW